MADGKTFVELGLNADILAGIAELGFEFPTPVQQAVIPRLLAGQRDLVGLAQTGTGKTAAFGLPILQQIDPDSRVTQALILCPTRELCVQITKDLTAFAKHQQNVRVLAVYGGSSMENQIAALQRGVQVIVATPGRINDLLRRGKAKLDQVRRVVLDEADEMLNMGFQEDLETILKQVPDGAQTLLFSATMPAQVAAIAGNYMHNPEEITIGTRNAGAENVEHVCYTVHARDRYLALKRVADFYPDMYGIVFCRTRQETQDVADKLMKDGYNADALHGDLTQVQRDRVMDRFRQRQLHMLVATDIAARGLDVTDLTHIINYNLPDDLDAYTHRSGRTGRAGKKGISVAIVHMREKGKIHRIERIINKKFAFPRIPTGPEVCAAQLLKLIARVKEVEVNHEQIDRYLPEVQQLLEGMSREELIKHFVSLEFNRFLDYYRGAPDLNTEAGKSTDRADRGRATGSSGTRFTRLFINLGRKDGLTPRVLMGLINGVTEGRPVEMGRIDIMNTSAFFEVENRESAKVIEGLRQVEHTDRTVRVGAADEAGAPTAAREGYKRYAPRRGAPSGPRRDSGPRGDRGPRGAKPRHEKSAAKSGKPHRKGGKPK